MRRLPRLGLAFLVALVGIASACSPAGDGVPIPTWDDAARAAVVDSVQGMLSEYSALVAAGDLDALVLLYADRPDFVWIEDGRIAYRSQADVAEAFEGLRAMQADVRTTFQDPVITPLGPGLASLVTTLDQEFAMPDGTSFGFAGALSATIGREGTGWVFLNGHTSSEREDGGR